MVVTGSIKTSSVVTVPRPLQTGQAPLLLKENRAAPTLFSFAIRFRISSKNPKKVAGVERPVAVTGDWSTKMTCSGYCPANTSRIRELFPEPATPVTAVSTRRGISTETCFRLCRLACLTGRNPLGFLGSALKGISISMAFPVNVPEPRSP